MMHRIYFIIAVLLIGACTKSEFCIEPNAVSAVVRFKTYDSTQSLIDTPLINVSIYSTDATAPLIENIPSLSQINIYPNRASKQQTYVIEQNNVRDTMHIFYDKSEEFISDGCGYQTYFTLENVRHSLQNIDSVIIVEPQINNVAQATHIELIYK